MLNGLCFELHDFISILHLGVFVLIIVKHVFQYYYLVKDRNKFHVQLHLLHFARLLDDSTLVKLHQIEGVGNVLLDNFLFLVPSHKVMARGEHQVLRNEKASAIGYLRFRGRGILSIGKHLLRLYPSDAVEWKRIELSILDFQPPILVLENQLVSWKVPIIAIFITTISHQLLLT